MLGALKFVRGAISRKDYQPALTHFLIKDRRVMGYDGVIALSSPIDIDIEAAPKALPFIKAIERCTSETTSIALSPTGRINLRSGAFRATIDCTEEREVLHSVQPEGTEIKTSDEFIRALNMLEPFIGTDASRPWALGVLLRGYSAYATNNIIVAQYWLGEHLPDINLPAQAIKELIRINEFPVSVQLDTNSVTFHFEGDRWLRTQLLATDWPDVESLLNKAFDASFLKPFPSGFFEAIETLGPFVDKEGRVLFRSGVITTAVEGDIGASVEIQGLPQKGAYNQKMLLLLRDSIDSIDFTKHPKPCPIAGNKIRGVFLGMIDP